MADRFAYGTALFEQVVCDWATLNYYDLMIPATETDERKLASHGNLLWPQTTDPDPYELLVAALMADAARDWMDYLLDGDLEGIREIEDWFEKCPYGDAVLNELKWRTSKAGSYRELKRVRDSIRIIR